MRKLLIKLFIKDYENVKDPEVRESYGKMAGTVGIVSNALLCVMKIIVGLAAGSIAILADGINNLADASSSIVTLVGFRMAAKPADEDHPYGHARIEYIAGLIVSMLILIIGVQLLMSSVDKVRDPDPLTFSWTIVTVLVVSIAIKIWQALFNVKIGKTINSSTLKATGADSRNDVIATTVVLISVIAGHLTGLHLDGYMGCLVALFIIWSGIQLIKETSSPLLGQAPDPELVTAIYERINQYEDVAGVHDLVVHNYGPGRIFASVHVEVDAAGDLIKSHDMIDIIERTLSKDLRIHLVVHMDPLDLNDPLVKELNEKIYEYTQTLEGVVGIHDLRVVAGYSHQNIVLDVVASPGCPYKDAELKKMIDDLLKEINPTYFSVVTVDRNYTGR